MAGLLLGPMMRATDGDTATVWVETDAPCEVAVNGRTARTVTMLGHHYGFVAVEGVGEAEPYTVHLDGQRVWPVDDRFPPSLLRGLPGDRLRAVFGSCRSILPDESGDADRVDALREYAWRAATGRTEDLPDVLLLLGDQVYSDKHAPATRAFIRRRRGGTGPVGSQTMTFEEFAFLYREAWSEPAVRWLLSTVPTLMVFDDHEVIDNWNTSERWILEHRELPWWRERVVNALAAYWMYQHLGNLSPSERAEDACFAALSGGDPEPALRSFATRADRGEEGTVGARWSYGRDLGPARLAMVDSRDGRVLGDGRRDLLDADEWEWLGTQVRDPAPYLLVGTSIPLLLPRGLDDLERITTAASAGRWGRIGALVGERLRRAAQFNHWPAFPTSFDRMAGLLRTAAEPPRRGVLVLSGDVHYSYVARVRAWADGTEPAVPVHQVTSSPLCYDLHRTIAGGFRGFISRPGDAVGRFARRGARVRPAALDWEFVTGPWMNNVITTLSIEPDAATVRFERTRADGPVGGRLDVVAERSLQLA
jgi:hypothetical protein